jgi:hypothetical protein
LGYPTPVNPLQPIYAPFGNNGIRSSGLASFLSKEGRATRDFRAAEAVRAAEDAIFTRNSSAAEAQLQHEQVKKTSREAK